MKNKINMKKAMSGQQTRTLQSSVPGIPAKPYKTYKPNFKQYGDKGYKPSSGKGVGY